MAVPQGQSKVIPMCHSHDSLLLAAFVCRNSHTLTPVVCSELRKRHTFNIQYQELSVCTVSITMEQPISSFLSSIDSDFLKYEDDFKYLEHTTTKFLKFFKKQDFAKFRSEISELHKRILLTEIGRLQSPGLKRRLEEVSPCARPTAESNIRQDQLMPKRLSYNTGRAKFRFLHQNLIFQMKIPS